MHSVSQMGLLSATMGTHQNRRYVGRTIVPEVSLNDRFPRMLLACTMSGWNDKRSAVPLACHAGVTKYLSQA